jgi:hypothetical protein
LAINLVKPSRSYSALLLTCSETKRVSDINQYLIRSIMSLLNILLIIIIAGVILYLINNYIPMDRKIKRILNIVVVIILIVWLLKVFGVFGYLSNLHI